MENITPKIGSDHDDEIFISERLPIGLGRSGIDSLIDRVAAEELSRTTDEIKPTKQAVDLYSLPSPWDVRGTLIYALDGLKALIARRNEEQNDPNSRHSSNRW